MDWEELSKHKWLLHLVSPLRGRFYEVAFFSLFINLLALTVPIFTLQVYDRVVGHGATATLYALLSGVLIALCLDFIIKNARANILQGLALRLDAELGRKLYGKLAHIPLSKLENKPASFWQSLFSDIALIRAVFSGPTAILFCDMPFAIIFLVVIFWIATPVAWVILCFIPIFLGLTYFAAKFTGEVSGKERGNLLSRDALMNEMLFARSTVKALNINQAMQETWEKAHAHMIDESHERGKHTDFYLNLGQSLLLLMNIACISFGALAIIEGNLTIGALIAANMLGGKIIGPFNQLLTTWRSLAGARQSSQKLGDIFAMESEREHTTINRNRPHGVLIAEAITYSFEKEINPILNNLNIEFNHGIHAIIGKNGCGKSTFLKVLQGLYTPQKGRILIDGGDINQYSRQQLSQWIGYVPQELNLFAGTIKENIAKSHPSASDEEVVRAAQLARADEFISLFPEGYATNIGEAGTKLSGGQRQRIAIARALLKDPSILIFDEITSSLDSEAEMEILQTLKELSANHTLIIATHSIPILRNSDSITVMQQGQIAMRGAAHDVLNRLAGKGGSNGAA